MTIWMAIEDAPTDGSEVYLYIPELSHHHHRGVVVGLYMRGSWMYPAEQRPSQPTRMQPFEGAPTHWTYFPPRPPDAHA
ncbi:MAG: hypothetical protein OXH92_08255 [Bryobacterales bacterium]|nr:hypothetical protein [Bryobacterales bacterium]